MELLETKSFPGPIELVRQAYSTYRSIYKVIIPVLLISFLASSFQVIVGFTSGHSSFIYFIGTLLSFVLVYLSYLAIVIAITTPSPEHAITSTLYQKAWLIFYSYIIIFLLMSVSMLAGSILLVIPGIIIAVLLCLTPYVFVVEKKQGMHALVKSWYYVKGNWWRVLGRILVFGILIVCLLALLSLIISITGINTIGPMTTVETGHIVQKVSLLESIINQAFSAFVVTPLSISFLYMLYKALRNRKPEEPDEAQQKSIRKILYGTMIAGIVMTIIMSIVIAVYAVKMFPTVFPQQQIPSFFSQNL